MSIETSVNAVLVAVCPRVRPTVAEAGIAVPFMTWQVIGGEPINAMNNELPGQRRVLVQVNAWAMTQLEAINLIKAAEVAMRSSDKFVAMPSGEVIAAQYEPDTKRYGSLQRYSIWGDR